MTRSFVAAAAFALAGAMSTAQAQTVTVGMYGGSFEKAIREAVVPSFQKQFPNAKFEYVLGNSTDTLARLQAQKARQEIDVAIMDDGVMYQAVTLGFCTDVADAPIYRELYDLAKVSGNKAMMAGVVATGLAYNTKVFKEKGWAAPTSWHDLKDPKYKKVFAMSPFTGTYGLHTVIMLARVDGGGENNIDPGFKAMQRVGPNVLTFPPSPAKMSEVMQSGDVLISVWGSGRTVALANTGFPVEFAYPKEGAVALMIGICPVVNSDVPDLAQKFIQHMFTTEVQAVMAKEQGAGPVNKNTKLAPDVAKLVPYGPDQVAKLITVDWDVINKNREQWTRRWNREVEK
ncbi:MAG: extracellular solute-binding protein [Alphaproteobacteria bacterium]|nr:extracellular solute-binding protein [Alphaproteobacteria bacterium]MBM3733888.1 extracellular solute-binding protein [Acidimicrobiia bacterium]